MTFLFTDLEGSTPLWDAQPAVMQDALARHDEILRSAIAAHGGFIFSTGGDSLGAVFQRSVDAVRASVDAQQELQAEPWPHDLVLRVRMGVHTGEAQERDGNYFGSAVNRAARVASAGHGGQILLSRVTVEMLGPQKGIDYVDLGSHRLRGLSEDTHLFGVRADGMSWVDSPPRTVGSVNGNVPRTLTEFIGSTTELQERADDISRGPLVTLIGPGGIGMSCTAMEIGALANSSYQDGAWFVDLAPLSEHEALVAAVGSTLAVRQRAGQSTTESIVDWLENRRLLLILDNCEHVIQPVGELVAAVMASLSRHLNSGHQPGATRDCWGASSVRRCARSALEAATLFCVRAAAADASFEVDDFDRLTIEAICSRLDGLPLAIELAAARVRSLSPHDILQRLDDRFRLLKSSRSAGRGHHRTLRATVDWSYQLLGDEERRLFDRLSVFAGGFDIRAAEAVCATTESERLDVVDLLASLVDKSMITARHQETETRFWLLETLRQYSAERLEDRGEVTLIRDRHLDHFVEVTQDLATQWASRRQAEAAASFEREWDNIRAAFGWTLAQDDFARADVLISATAPHADSRIIHEHGDWVNRALEQCERAGNPPSASMFGWAAHWSGFVTGDQQKATD